MARCNCCQNFFRCGLRDAPLSDHHGWCFATCADARRFDNAHGLRIRSLQEREAERLCARQLTGERGADANCEGRWLFGVRFDAIKMRIEGGHFLDLGHGQIHPRSQGATICGWDTAQAILNDVKILDKPVGRTIRVLQGRFDERQRRLIERPAAGRGARCAAVH